MYKVKGPFTIALNYSVLVFSPWPITSVMVSVDNHVYQDAHPDSQHSPLYVLPWQPQMYSHGMHTLKVKARVRSHDSDH